MRTKDIIAIENVQQRATKLVPGLKDLGYEDRLRRLDMPSLSYRRHRGDMIELFKMLNEKYDAESCPILTRNESITRSNTMKLYKTRVRTKLRQHDFTSRITESWNSLQRRSSPPRRSSRLKDDWISSGRIKRYFSVLTPS